MIYKNYLDAIVRYYNQKKSESDLPLRLLQPKPSKIRDECVSVYRSRFLRKDQGMLTSFFGVYGEADLLRTIENIDIDKFRPLVNFLKGGTDATEDKNIELLGWLLDFPKRPYDDKYNYEVDKDLLIGEGIDKGDQLITKEDVNGAHLESHEPADTIALPEPVYGQSDNKGDNNIITVILTFVKERWRLIAVAIILLITGATIYFGNTGSKSSGISGQQECMVWVNDHYVQVLCDSPGKVGDVWPLDKNRLNNLRRITQPDTITEKYIGKLWYQKRGGDSLDYYTAGGKDPNNPNRDLNRLTVRIFKKYLRKEIQ